MQKPLFLSKGHVPSSFFFWNDIDFGKTLKKFSYFFYFFFLFAKMEFQSGSSFNRYDSLYNSDDDEYKQTEIDSSISPPHDLEPPIREVKPSMYNPIPFQKGI
jgi:hypothetical protein